MDNIQEKSFVCEKKFFDDRNFPRGFQRSGDFTRSQAIILETKGVALKALHEGSRAPSTKEEEQFVAVCRGTAKAATETEKTWAIYLNALRRKQIYFTASSAAVAEGGSDGMDSDD